MKVPPVKMSFVGMGLLGRAVPRPPEFPRAAKGSSAFPDLLRKLEYMSPKRQKINLPAFPAGLLKAPARGYKKG
jgi:hypothetical protein